MQQVFVTDPNKQPPIVPLGGGYIAHVNCNGARWHVLAYSTSGVTCSEPRCIFNKPKEVIEPTPTASEYAWW